MNTDFQDPIPVISNAFQVYSLNRIKIQVILLILQLETDYFSSSFISEEIHSKQWHYSLHRDFQNCILHEEVLQDSPVLHTIRESIQKTVSYPESSSTCKKTKSSSSTLQDLPKAFQTSQSFMAFSLARQYYMHLRIPPSYSIFQLECIFYILTGFHRNSTEYQLGHYKLQAYILQRKGDVVISVKYDTILHNRIISFNRLVIKNY